MVRAMVRAMATEDQLVLRVATMLYVRGRPLASAILFADVAAGSADPAVWTGLGAALASAAGALVREPFLEAAWRALERAAPIAKGTPFAEVVDEWRPKLLAELGERPDLGPMKDEELAPLLDLLHVGPEVLIEAVGALESDDRMLAMMAIGGREDERYLPALLAAAGGKWGAGPARSALKRMGRYRGRPELHEAVDALKERGLGQECRPYYEGLLASEVPQQENVKERSGLPGGIALPGVLFAVSMAAFVVFWMHPGWLTFGEAIGARINPAGLGVMGAAVTFFWLLVAIGKRAPSR